MWGFLSLSGRGCRTVEALVISLCSPQCHGGQGGKMIVRCVLHMPEHIQDPEAVSRFSPWWRCVHTGVWCIWKGVPCV